MKVLVFLILLTFSPPLTGNSKLDADTAYTGLMKRHRDLQKSGDLFNDYLMLSQAAGQYEADGKLCNLAGTHNALGNLFEQLDETDLALKNFLKAEALYAKCGDSISTTKIKLNIANCYFKQGERQKAKEILLPLEREAISRQDTDYHASVLFSLLRSFMSDNDIRSYFSYVDTLKMLPLSNPKLNYKRNTHLGFCQYLKKNYAASIALYREAMLEAKRDHDPAEANCILGLIYNFTATRQYDSATVYWNKYHLFKDSVENVAYASQIKQMESLNTIKNYEAQLKQEQEKMALLQQIIVLTVILILLSIAVVVIILRNKKQKAHIEKELEDAKNRELTALLNNERLQNRARKMEIENQSRRLCLNLMILEEKANALKSVRQQISDANVNGKIPPEIAQTIDNQIKYHLQDTSNWNAFKESFEKIRPDFFQKLKSEFPKLSEHELRFCAYACSGLDSKQIAFILNIQIESIRKIRQRLRKKLGLDPAESLEEFLRNFSADTPPAGNTATAPD